MNAIPLLIWMIVMWRIYIYIYNISYVNRNTIIIIFNNIYYYVHLKKTYVRNIPDMVLEVLTMGIKYLTVNEMIVVKS